MSKFTKEDLQWLKEQGFKYNGHGDYNLDKGHLHVSISAGEFYFYCRAELLSVSEYTPHQGNTMGEAIKKCIYQVCDDMAKRSSSLDTLLGIAKKFTGEK